MADIAELGLDASKFNREMDSAVEKMKALGTEAALVTGNLLVMAAVAAGVLAKGIYDSRQKAKELADTLREIETSDPFGNKLASLGEFEKRLKLINKEIKEMDDEGIGERIFRFAGSARLVGGKGFDESEDKRAEQRIKFAKEFEETLQKIAARQSEYTRVFELQLQGQDTAAKLLKNELDYREKIAKAIEGGNGPLAIQLTKEQLITAELIKQNALYNDPARKAASSRAEEEAKNAMDAARGDVRNQQIIDDREADKKQKEIDTQRNHDAEQYQEFLSTKDSDNQTKTDFESEEFKKWRSNRDADNQEKANFETAEYQRWLVNQDKNKRAFAAENRELSGELTVTDLARRGNRTAANKEKTAQDYDRKIREAIKSGNKDGEELLRKQANAAQAGSDVEESKKTAADRREERKAARTLESDEVKAKAQNDDLDDRLAKGAKGDKNSRLEQRREENARNADRANQQDKARKGEDEDGRGGYGKEDRAFLREIRDALKPKD